MARITVEDCIRVVPNYFELTLMAAARSRELSQGAEPQVEIDRDKPEIIALREIAERRLDLDSLGERLIRSMQLASGNSTADDDVPDQDLTDLEFERQATEAVSTASRPQAD